MAAPSVHGPYSLPSGKKRLLGQFLGAFMVFEPPPEEAVQRPTIARKQLLERRARSPLELQNQGFITDHGCRCFSFRSSAMLCEISYTTCNVATAKKAPWEMNFYFRARRKAGGTYLFCWTRL